MCNDDKRHRVTVYTNGDSSGIDLYLTEPQIEALHCIMVDMSNVDPKSFSKIEDKNNTVYIRVDTIEGIVVHWKEKGYLPKVRQEELEAIRNEKRDRPI